MRFFSRARCAGLNTSIKFNAAGTNFDAAAGWVTSAEAWRLMRFAFALEFLTA